MAVSAALAALTGAAHAAQVGVLDPVMAKEKDRYYLFSTGLTCTRSMLACATPTVTPATMMRAPCHAAQRTRQRLEGLHRPLQAAGRQAADVHGTGPGARRGWAAHRVDSVLPPARIALHDVLAAYDAGCAEGAAGCERGARGGSGRAECQDCRPDGAGRAAAEVGPFLLLPGSAMGDAGGMRPSGLAMS